MAAALATTLGVCFAAVSTRAQESVQESTVSADCAGNPNALGTSRVVTIDPGDYRRLGRMQYPDSLPLADKEVVLTFDDGPLPPYSNQILDILAAQCVKATYFMVGSMARAYPATARRVFMEGHTIGTHSEHHPSNFSKLPIEKVRQEINDGIVDVAQAIGDPRAVAPFFRFPGLDRSDAAESELAARALVVFSSDTVADDWHHGIKPDQITALALKRLEARGKGILLLHDIHPKTVAALPGLLKALKDNGFRIVQVVPAVSDQIEMAAQPRILASAMPEQLMISGGAPPAWPQSETSLAPDLAPEDAVLPAPDAAAFDPDTGVADDTGTVKWPDRPKFASAEPEPPVPSTKKLAERPGRHHSRASSHDRHRAEPAHSNRRTRTAANDKPAGIASRVKSFAAQSSAEQLQAH